MANALHERARAAAAVSPTVESARPARPATENGQRLLVFQVAGQPYALPVADIREILFMAALSRPPGLPALLAGILNLGGDAVPVLRLDRLLGLPEQSPGLYTPLLLLHESDPPLALMVESLGEITLVRDGVLPLPADHSFNDCVDGLVPHRGDIALLLSVQRLLLEKEQQQLADLHDREQARLREWEGTAS